MDKFNPNWKCPDPEIKGLDFRFRANLKAFVDEGKSATVRHSNIYPVTFKYETECKFLIDNIDFDFLIISFIGESSKYWAQINDMNRDFFIENASTIFSRLSFLEINKFTILLSMKVKELDEKAKRAYIALDLHNFDDTNPLRKAYSLLKPEKDDKTFPSLDIKAIDESLNKKHPYRPEGLDLKSLDDALKKLSSGLDPESFVVSKKELIIFWEILKGLVKMSIRYVHSLRKINTNTVALEETKSLDLVTLAAIWKVSLESRK